MGRVFYLRIGAFSLDYCSALLDCISVNTSYYTLHGLVALSGATRLLEDISYVSFPSLFESS